MNGPLDFLLFYLDRLHLVKKDNVKLVKSILKVIDSTITGSVWPTDSKFNLEYFPTLPRIVPLRNYVSFSIFIFKDFSTISGQPITGCNIRSSKSVGASYTCPNKPIFSSIVRASKRISAIKCYC